MVEAWTQLQSQRAAQQKAADAVNGARKTWDEKHEEKNELARFKDTYEEVVEALRARYTNPVDEAWFAGNEDLLKELDDLFNKLKAREADLADIEARIAKEKQGWYRRTLRSSGAGTVVEKTVGRPTYLGALDEASDFEDATKRVQRALEGGGAANPTLSDLLSKLDGLEGERRAEALIDLFFRDTVTGEVPASCAGAADLLRGGASLEDAVRELQRGRDGAAAAKRQAAQIRREVADLKRGQAAHMQDKMAKAQDRQRKQQGPRVEAAMYDNLPAGASPDEVRACVLCQIFAGLGMGRGHVYMMAESSEDDHETHVTEEHKCAAGERCVQLTDEDVSMGGQEDEGSEGGVVICRECAEDLERPTVYCSARCAGVDIQRHRESAHPPGRRGSGSEGSGPNPNPNSNSDSKDSKGDGGHDEDVRRFVMEVDEALERFVKGRNPDMEIQSV